MVSETALLDMLRGGISLPAGTWITNCDFRNSIVGDA